jgi:serine/threonine protein kinase HipA of HipAB toxin-antitoxin module
VPKNDYQQIARFLTEHSDLPMLDIRTVAARAVLTILFADTTWDVRSIWMTDVDGTVRLAPFPVVSCEAETSQGGMLIGSETPSEWLRADHFVALAKDLGIAPKVIFGLMSELTQSVPPAVEAAVRQVYPKSYHRGHGAELVRAVRGRSVRLGDVVSSAGYQGIAGIAKPISLFVKREEDESSYLGHETIYD